MNRIKNITIKWYLKKKCGSEYLPTLINASITMIMMEHTSKRYKLYDHDELLNGLYILSKGELECSIDSIIDITKSINRCSILYNEYQQLSNMFIRRKYLYQLSFLLRSLYYKIR